MGKISNYSVDKFFARCYTHFRCCAGGFETGKLKSYRKLQKIVDNLDVIMVFYESCPDWQ